MVLLYQQKCFSSPEIRVLLFPMCLKCAWCLCKWVYLLMCILKQARDGYDIITIISCLGLHILVHINIYILFHLHKHTGNSNVPLGWRSIFCCKRKPLVLKLHAVRTYRLMQLASLFTLVFLTSKTGSGEEDSAGKWEACFPLERKWY